MKTYHSVSELQQTKEYDYFLLDLWGVVHNDRELYPGAKDCLLQLKKRGKTIIFISNSSSNYDQLVEELAQLDIGSNCYDYAFSAGTVTCHWLKHRNVVWARELGRRYYYIGPERRRAMMHNLDYIVTDNLRQADFIIITGFNEKQKELDDYQELLKQAKVLDLPMVCTNPDKMFIKHDNSIGYCAGAIAAFYEQKYRGKVFYVGKPLASFYQYCLDVVGIKENAGDDRKDKIIALGDSLTTDVKGANNMGISVGLILETGITSLRLGIGKDKNIANNVDKKINIDRLEQDFHAVGARPNFMLTRLMW